MGAKLSLFGKTNQSFGISDFDAKENELDGLQLLDFMIL